MRPNGLPLLPLITKRKSQIHNGQCQASIHKPQTLRQSKKRASKIIENMKGLYFYICMCTQCQLCSLRGVHSAPPKSAHICREIFAHDNFYYYRLHTPIMSEA